MNNKTGENKFRAKKLPSSLYTSAVYPVDTYKARRYQKAIESYQWYTHLLEYTKKKVKKPTLIYFYTLCDKQCPLNIKDNNIKWRR